MVVVVVDFLSSHASAHDPGVCGRAGSPSSACVIARWSARCERPGLEPNFAHEALPFDQGRVLSPLTARKDRKQFVALHSSFSEK